jgi:Lhr-like helicase
MINTEEKASLLKRLNIVQQNEMQIAAENAIQAHKDVMVLSATGSGKTLA